jgi:hypothetical protein
MRNRPARRLLMQPRTFIVDQLEERGRWSIGTDTPQLNAPLRRPWGGSVGGRLLVWSFIVPTKENLTF